MGYKFTQVKAVQDDESDWFVIPADLYKRFEWYQAMFNSGVYKEDQDMIEEFEAEFSEYRTGGDLNLTELWTVKQTDGN